MDEPDFEQHRRELHLHCYRMLASFDEAEDAVQETFLRAWKGRDTFDGSAQFRAWLYKIATNTCLDMVRRRSRQVPVLESFAEVPWLQPYPDALLNEMAPARDEPDSVAVDRETIELMFIATMQLLPARQRAAFIARDVLDWSAKETATLLGTSVAASNSALQRARSTMQEHLSRERSEWSKAELSDEERDLLAKFIDAHERLDAEQAIAISAKDIRVTMPPLPACFDGISQVATLIERAFGPERDGDWRLLPTYANRMPTAASYLRRPGDTVYRAFKLDVLRVRMDVIVEITTFGSGMVKHFGLPETL
ncbi:RNA polymerase subunit sigma-70 [Kibdelosporangium philippinense]|uniref:RNA polymerase subunit sigma-70 n=1 Tax=Kibdelosporangium philippinense TaxID=211113 RepID=A0ABS8ZH80_9PSEU|nr:RNA polymerase subunit sigma-70 [Kibdelosporangium philippinense]MCE7006699.1 RNA polymerase subunit sigma-70 [Kibdelosporangium philippinense]